MFTYLSNSCVKFSYFNTIPNQLKMMTYLIIEISYSFKGNVCFGIFQFIIGIHVLISVYIINTFFWLFYWNYLIKYITQSKFFFSFKLVTRSKSFSFLFVYSRTTWDGIYLSEQYKRLQYKLSPRKIDYESIDTNILIAKH